MQNKLIWSKDQFEPIVIIASVTLGYLIYLTLVSSKKIEKTLNREHTNVYWIAFQRLAGVFLFGIVPLLITTLILKKSITSFGVNSNNLLSSLLWFAGLTCIIIPMSYFATKSPNNLAMYPQVRRKEWTPGLLIISALLWILYLMAYEFMFRGFLLFGLIPYLGLWPAIALNLAFYSLMHIPKGMKETIGAIPFGAIICILTISTGNVWVALFAHMSLALSNEWFSLYHQPEMKLVRTK